MVPNTTARHVPQNTRASPAPPALAPLDAEGLALLLPFTPASTLATRRPPSARSRALAALPLPLRRIMSCCVGRSVPVIRFVPQPHGPLLPTPEAPSELLHTLRDRVVECLVTGVLSAGAIEVLLCDAGLYYTTRICINGYEPYASPEAAQHLQALLCPRPDACVYITISSTGRLVRGDVFLDRRVQKSVAEEMLNAGFGARLKEAVFVQARPLKEVNETHAVISFRHNDSSAIGGNSKSNKSKSKARARAARAKAAMNSNSSSTTSSSTATSPVSTWRPSSERPEKCSPDRLLPYNFAAVQDTRRRSQESSSAQIPELTIIAATPPPPAPVSSSPERPMHIALPELAGSASPTAHCTEI